MAEPIIYYDPTSEPSRAVYWFALEASIPVELHYTWLSRNEHHGQEFLAVNPRHQVPAMRHDDFRLSEATAIIRYLAETAGVEAEWLGRTTRDRARTNMLLSWYHTNLRQKLTLGYFLPVLLAPSYRGVPRPVPAEAERLRGPMRDALGRVEEFLGKAPFLGGERPTIPDLLFAPEIFALDCDADRDSYLGKFPATQAWLQRLRSRPTYATTHDAWNAVAPLMQERLKSDGRPGSIPSWVAATCERVLKIA